MGGNRKPGTTGGAHPHPKNAPRPVPPAPVHKKAANQHTAPAPAGKPAASKPPVTANKVKRIVVVYDATTSAGQLFAIAPDGSIAVKGDVVVGGPDTKTPTGTFHASYWEKDHVSTKYGGYANTPWSKSPLGLNAFGPFQLHLKELETRGIYLHGTMGPSWNPVTTLNSFLSSTSHGCVRMANQDDVKLHDMLPHPDGIEVKISTDKGDIPVQKAAP